MPKITKLNIDCDDKDLKAVIEKMKRNMPDQLKINALLAVHTKSLYDEYVKAGFTPEQAIDLCKKA